MGNLEVYTLDARNNVLLEATRDYFDIGSSKMQHEIQVMLAQTQAMLRTKGITYRRLKSALVPNTNRRDIALVFDTSRIQEPWYGFPIYRALIPLFDIRSNHSILAGDYIGRDSVQDLLYESFCEGIHLTRKVEWHHSTQFFIVYVNNLTEKMSCTLRKGLTQFEPYIGFADMTFASRFKLHLSTMLVNSCLKSKDVVLMADDDADNSRDVNVKGYPWEDFGYKCRSLQDTHFGLFLSYKIERPIFHGFESDTEFSINAVDPDPFPIADFEIRIDEMKLGYLASKKSGTLKRMGLISDHLSKLKSMIAKKISSNYIYNMKHDDSHGTTTFNIVLEIYPSDGTPQRVLAVLEYIAVERCLRLVTLY